jgi:hypothetical protein
VKSAKGKEHGTKLTRSESDRADDIASFNSLRSLKSAQPKARSFQQSHSYQTIYLCPGCKLARCICKGNG